MENLQNITLDILNYKITDYIYTKQYDIGRQVKFTVTEHGVPIDLSNYTIMFMLMKPDGTCVLDRYDGEGTYFTLTISEQMTTVSGKLPYQLTLCEGDNLISTVTGYMMCDKAAVSNDAVESHDSSNFLSKIDEAIALWEAVLHPTIIVLTADGWENRLQRIDMEEIKEDEDQFIVVRPLTRFMRKYVAYGIMCIEQHDGYLVFECGAEPNVDIGVMIASQYPMYGEGGGGTNIIYSETEPIWQPNHGIWIQEYDNEEEEENIND